MRQISSSFWGRFIVSCVRFSGAEHGLAVQLLGWLCSFWVLSVLGRWQGLPLFIRGRSGLNLVPLVLVLPCSDYLFKLLLIGDSGVGKSCLLLRFAVFIRCPLFPSQECPLSKEGLGCAGWIVRAF